MADWDTDDPADDDLVSQFPSNERAARAAVRTNFGIDHHEANDANIGKHEAVQMMDQASNPTFSAGEVGVWNNGGNLNTRVASGTVQRVMKGESGTKMIFYQASAPTGWTQDVAINDRVLRVVSGAGGASGGSWTISGVTVDNHVLTVSEMPAHDHGGASGSAGSHNHGGATGSNGGHSHTQTVGGNQAVVDAEAGGGPSFTASGVNNTTTGSVGNHTHSISTQAAHTHTISSQGGGSGHTHGVTADGNWRPSHIDVIAASLD